MRPLLGKGSKGDTKFIGTRLMESDFTGATMKGVDLYEANLSKGILRDTDCTGGYLLRLNLQEVDLTNAKLTGADFYRSDLRRASAWTRRLTWGRAASSTRR